MIVVSDSSTLVSLAAIGQLHLLHEFFGRVILPGAVLSEVLAGGAGKPGFHELTTLEWLEVIAVQDRNALQPLDHLDLGEAEAIVLAQELGADLLLMDELDGRQAAAERGLRLISVLGLLSRAKHEGRIDAVRPLVQRLRDEMRFRISETLLQRVLRDVHEE
jgi:predicted nucleic acid-binding protein